MVQSGRTADMALWILAGALATAAGCGSLGGDPCDGGGRVSSSDTSASLDGAWRLTVSGAAPPSLLAAADGACITVEQGVATAWRQGCTGDILGGSFEAREDAGRVELEAVVRINAMPQLLRLALQRDSGTTLGGRVLLIGEGGQVQACAPVELSPG